jgi:hypothetical protein
VIETAPVGRDAKEPHPKVLRKNGLRGPHQLRTNTHFTEELPVAFKMCRNALDRAGQPLPTNAGKTPDKLLRRRDCAVLNYYLSRLEQEQVVFDTVRCGFVEGLPAFEGSGIRHQSHVQLAVRNPACVVGVFRPTMAS